jgi:hypothetical protein
VIKAAISSQYKRERYEDRSPTHYAWYRGPMSAHEENVQAVLLGQPKGTSVLTRTLHWLLGR